MLREPVESTGCLQRLSLAALRMVASDRWEEPKVLAQWLYRFGTVPRGPTIDRDFGPGDDPMAVLGLTLGGGARRWLEPSYLATPSGGWYSFTHTSTPLQFSAACKLYVSPRPEMLAEAFPCIAHEFAWSAVRSFKVGRGIEGLLRPDKIVAYFEDRAHLESVARGLERVLWGCRVQGVPFTAEIGGKGLLSWGVDPPTEDSAISWRSWVTTRLAASLMVWHQTPHRDPVEAALANIRTAGVDPENWQPNADAFSDGSPK